jgi:hypothetical protein
MGTESGLTVEDYNKIMSSAPPGCRYVIINKIRVPGPEKKRQATTEKRLPPSIQELKTRQHNPSDLATRCKDASQRRGAELLPLQTDSMKRFTDLQRLEKVVKGATERDICIKCHITHLNAHMCSYFRVFDQFVFYGTLWRHSTLLYAYMCNYFRVFEQLFFGGRLWMNCVLVVSPDFKEGVKGICRPDAKIGKCVITLYNMRGTTFEQRVQSYLGTLLHEMLHAYLVLYVRGEYDPHPGCHLGVGHTHHGVAWQNIAQALEQAVNDPKLLGLQLDLGRQNSLDHELYYTEERNGFMGVDKPGQSMDPKRWGLERRDELQKKIIAEHAPLLQGSIEGTIERPNQR